jgi:hypothetical protein
MEDLAASAWAFFESLTAKEAIQVISVQTVKAISGLGPVRDPIQIRRYVPRNRDKCCQATLHLKEFPVALNRGVPLNNHILWASRADSHISATAQISRFRYIFDS